MLSLRGSLAGQCHCPGKCSAPSCELKAVLFILKKAQAGDLLVSIWSKLGERALVLIILKGSSGTPVTLVTRAENAIFLLPDGKLSRKHYAGPGRPSYTV